MLSQVDLLQSIDAGIKTLVFIGGMIVGLTLAAIFAREWGRNSWIH